MEKLVELLSDVLDIIEEAKEKKDLIFAWYVFNDHTLKVELRVHNVDMEKEEILLCPDPQSVFYIKEMISGLGTISVYMPNALLIFSAEFKNLDEEGRMRIAFPSIFKVHDRRGWDRVQLESKVSAIFALKGKSWNKNVFDLGTGGMSIVFNKNEHFRGSMHEVIDKVEIRIGNQNTYCECTIVNILQLNPYMLESCPYGGTRVSFKFNKLNENTKDFLEGILFSHIGLLKDLA